MDKHLKRMSVACAITAFVFCLGGGLWILTKTGFDRGNDIVATGIGLYFIGKAFFVGPLLLIAARKLN